MTTTAIATVEPSLFPVLGDPSVLADLVANLRENLEGEEASRYDLPIARLPSGGGLSFQISDPVLGDQETQELRGVILSQDRRRSYWATDLEEHGGAPPDCASKDLLVGVGNPGGSCETCPMAQFGTARKGSGQACKVSVEVLFLRQGDTLPIIVSVPPSSLKILKRFAVGLTLNSLPKSRTVITLRLKKAKSKGGAVYSELVLGVGGQLDDEMAEAARAYADSVNQSFTVPALPPAPAQAQPVDLTKEDPPETAQQFETVPAGGDDGGLIT